VVFSWRWDLATESTIGDVFVPIGFAPNPTSFDEGRILTRRLSSKTLLLFRPLASEMVCYCSNARVYLGSLDVAPFFLSWEQIPQLFSSQLFGSLDSIPPPVYQPRRIGSNSSISILPFAPKSGYSYPSHVDLVPARTTTIGTVLFRVLGYLRFTISSDSTKHYYIGCSFSWRWDRLFS
jgi:hypothetical protein